MLNSIAQKSESCRTVSSGLRKRLVFYSSTNDNKYVDKGGGIVVFKKIDYVAEMKRLVWSRTLLRIIGEI